MNGLIEHDSLTSSDKIEPKHKFLFKLSLMLYYIAITLSVRPSVHTFVTDISASTGRNDFIFDIWLWHGDLFHVSPFQVYRTSISCLQCDLEFFMFAVMKTFVTIISASTGRNDLIFDIWLWHGDLYRVSPFQVYRTSTSCLLGDLQMNEWGYS